MEIKRVTDPKRIVTDALVLRELGRQGIDKDFVEFFEDYSPVHPAAKFYRDLKSNKRVAVFSAYPHVAKDGKKIIPRWLKSGETYHADTNAFFASVDGKRVNLGQDGKASSWSPQVFLNGVEVLCDPNPVLLDDPSNKGYKRNILSWDYGFCKRQLKLVNGAILENYILAHHPDYKEGMVVKGECKQCGKCDAGCVFQNEDGTCSVYDEREERGLLDCIKYPDVDDLLANTAIPTCGYWIEYQGQKFEPKHIDLIIKSNLAGDIKFNRPWCSEGVLAVAGDEKRFSFDWRRADGVRPCVWHYPLIIDDSATFYSTTSDGYVKYLNADWDTCHDALTGSGSGDSDVQNWWAMRASWESRAGAFEIYRDFFYFDTSSLGAGATVSAATFSLYGYSQADSDVVAMKGTQATPLTTADFDSFTGSEYGHVSWGIGAYQDIVFNAQGRSDIEVEGITKICTREYSHDYLDVSPGTSAYNNGCYYTEEGTGYKPKLAVTYTSVVLPTVTAQAATNVTSSSATGHGNITNTGGENCDKRGFVYGKSSESDPGNVAPGSSGYDDFVEDTGDYGTGAFSKTLPSLDPNTTYYYRAYAHNSEGYDYSNTEIEFTTLVALPSVTASAATNVTSNSATGNGEITGLGGENCDKRGFVFGKTSKADPGDVAPGSSGYDDFAEDTGDFGTGAFSKSLESLDPDTDYYYRAYAHNSAGYEYSDTEIEFTTGAWAGFIPRKDAFDGYRCFMQQYTKNKVLGVEPWKLPDGTLW